MAEEETSTDFVPAKASAGAHTRSAGTDAGKKDEARAQLAKAQDLTPTERLEIENFFTEQI
jgi:hypothetical protein